MRLRISRSNRVSHYTLADFQTSPSSPLPPISMPSASFKRGESAFLFGSCARQERMERLRTVMLTLCCVLLVIHQNVESASPSPSAMFVFGDSYVDTGNLDQTNAPWKPPYGVSFPGKPSGRLSDGKVLTDFIASAFNISIPVPYNQRDSNPNMLRFGMNFATGGTGIFSTWPGLPSTSTQIDQLQQLISNGVYSAKNLQSSLVLFSVSGNDYGSYILQQRGAVEGLPSFVESVIKQLSADLVRLYNMGFRRFAVTNMGPSGCLPVITAENSYTSCNDTINAIAVDHNGLLGKTVEGIRKSRANATFVILDQYTDSMAIFQHPTQYGQFKEPLKPCCTGSCGFTDNTGKPMYSVCAHPESTFFWDAVHPTQAGWETLMGHFRSSLDSFQLES